MVTMVRTIDKEKDIITYGIDPAHWNDGSKYFRIDEKTGQIFVRESLAGQVRRCSEEKIPLIKNQ